MTDGWQVLRELADEVLTLAEENAATKPDASIAFMAVSMLIAKKMRNHVHDLALKELPITRH